MPTILVENGFRLFFYANENNEPPHIHIQHQSATAKFWVTPVALANSKAMKPSDLKKAGDLVRKYEQFILEKWNEFNRKKT